LKMPVVRGVMLNLLPNVDDLPPHLLKGFT
jgi:hypothetical protein